MHFVEFVNGINAVFLSFLGEEKKRKELKMGEKKRKDLICNFLSYLPEFCKKRKESENMIKYSI